VFTSREGGTTAKGNQMLLRKEQWLEIGAMQSNDEGYESINTRTLDIDQLLPEVKERIKENTLLDEEYRWISNQLSSGNVTDNHYKLKDYILCWKNRVDAPKEM